MPASVASVSRLAPSHHVTCQVNDLEQRPSQGSGVMLLPRSAVLFPPRFRGYWQSAQQQQQQQQHRVQGQAEPAGLLDSRNSGADSTEPLNPAYGPTTALGSRSRSWQEGMGTRGDAATQIPHLRAVVAEVQAILAQKEMFLKPSPAGGRPYSGTSLEAWALHQLELASHWKAVDAVVQVLELVKAGAPTATAVDWRHAGVAVLERALLRLQELGLDPQLLGAQVRFASLAGLDAWEGRQGLHSLDAGKGTCFGQGDQHHEHDINSPWYDKITCSAERPSLCARTCGFGRSDWEGLGRRMSTLLASCCQASSPQPTIHYDPQRDERAAIVINTTRCLGPSFYCRCVTLACLPVPRVPGQCV
eukprot:scaffold48058_cov19-Tisochrysis_lutea.AAC.2